MSGVDRVEQTDEGLFDQIRELCLVFRAESGMACQTTINEHHTRFDVLVADAILFNIRRLLGSISKVGRATTVTLSSGIYADGSVFIRVENNGARIPLLAAGEAAPVAISQLCQFIIIDQRLDQVGGQLVIGDDSSSCATIVLPSRLVVDKR